VVGKVAIEALSQLNAHCSESVFVALSLNAQNEIVEVHLLAREAQQLAYAQPGVQGNGSDDVRPSLLTPDGLPLFKPMNLLRAKRRKDLLFFF
jgi:hypothetical protein